jgi:hypothetical protein
LKKEDEDIIDYYENLRISILETFSSLIVSSKENNDTSKLQKFDSGIVKYIDKVITEFSPNNEVKYYLLII